MIDPRFVTKFDRTEDELEEWWLFCLVVAGKNAMNQSKALERFIQALPGTNADSPLQRVSFAVQQNRLNDILKESRLGQYTKLAKSFTESVLHLMDKLKTCTVEDLEAIHGVGPKTARFFLVHSRENQRIAALDTHMLKFLREQGESVPKGHPGKGETYKRLEQAFIGYADAAKMSVADFDLMLWRRYSGNV